MTKYEVIATTIKDIEEEFKNMYKAQLNGNEKLEEEISHALSIDLARFQALTGISYHDYDKALKLRKELECYFKTMQR